MTTVPEVSMIRRLASVVAVLAIAAPSGYWQAAAGQGSLRQN